ncbi:hypothetical protein [Vreelandella neptunia]|uniref:Uncharacterized protein n=1 Tax=Vreelandella neptunia TaxID=115551 RepID=A0ABZ0YI89_9GAMM|nr:hypothetical protein [Halomonas neptunia]MDN3562119.1 hypothetical protein [Halomonas neptunia]WQH11821.1 hypothetical protein SR894_16910 [Halomonas neptunia]
MSNYARIKNNVAVDVSAAPASQFHPTIAAEFEAVPDEVQRGWQRAEDGIWSAPPEVVPEAPEPERPRVGPVEFKLLFTSPERLKLKELRSTDPAINDFFEIIEDPRLQYVDLALASTQQGVEHSLNLLVEAGIVDEGNVATRREQILSGNLL